MQSRTALAFLFAVLSSSAACAPTSEPEPSGPSGAGGSSSSAGGAPGRSGGTVGTGGAGTGGVSGSGGAVAAGGAPGSGGAAGTGGVPGAGGSSGTGGPDAPVASEAGAGVDAPADSAPAGACAGLFCDGFESYAAGSMPGGNWKPVVRSGTLAVDEQKAFSGARSMLVKNQGAADAKSFIELGQPVLPLPSNIMHGRLMFQLTKAPTGTNAHSTVVRGSGLLTPAQRAQYNVDNEAGKFMINYEPNDCSKYSKVVFPEKRWACLQWEFDGSKNPDGSTKSGMHLWIDGTPVTDIAITGAMGNCWKAPPVFDTVHIGWQQYHAGQPVEFWVDDIAVGDKPIPCPTGMPSKP